MANLIAAVRSDSRWSRGCLGDIRFARIIMGQSPSSSSYNTEGRGLPFFQGRADFGLRNPKPRIWCDAPARIAGKGDVLLCVRAPVGDVNVASESCCIGRGLAAVQAGPDSYGEFLYFLLYSNRERLDRLGSGAIFRAINKNTLHTLEFQFPSLPEQRAIAGVLSKIRRAVELEEKRIVALKELKAATMAKVFREGLRGERLKKTEIGEVPESWEIRRFDEVAKIERGKFSHRPRNDPDFYGGNIPFIQTGDVVRGCGHVRTYTQTLNELGLSVSRVFPRGTIVLTIAANIADTGILEFDSAFPDSLVGVTPGKGMLAEFLEFFLRTQKTAMDRLAPKGTQKNINIQFLRPWPVLVPQLGEQQEIVRLLAGIDQRLENAERRRAVSELHFQSSLHQVMTGQLRVTALMDETPS